MLNGSDGSSARMRFRISIVLSLFLTDSCLGDSISRFNVGCFGAPPVATARISPAIAGFPVSDAFRSFVFSRRLYDLLINFLMVSLAYRPLRPTRRWAAREDVAYQVYSISDIC